MENLSNILSHLMAKTGIKSAELARKTGIGQPVVYRLMTGTTENPQILTLKPIADFFGVSIDQLIGLTSLENQKPLNTTLVHDLTNKLNTIKTIASVLTDFLPALIEGYQKAISAGLTKETVPADILPLLALNINNLLKATNQIQELLTTSHYKHQD